MPTLKVSALLLMAGVVVAANDYESARIRRQVFGGVNRLPGGRQTQTIGYQAGPAWGSVSKNVDARGRSGPNTFSAGAGFTSNQGHGISGRADRLPGGHTHLSARGQVGIVNTPNHKVTVWGQHDNTLLRPHRSPQRRFETNSAGINYKHRSGAGAFASVQKTPGQRTQGSVGGNVPLVNRGRTRLDLGAQSNFQSGRKPNHQAGLTFSHRF